MIPLPFGGMNLMWVGVAVASILVLRSYRIAKREKAEGVSGSLLGRTLFGLQVEALWAYRVYVLPLIGFTVATVVTGGKLFAFSIAGLATLDPGVIGTIGTALISSLQAAGFLALNTKTAFLAIAGFWIFAVYLSARGDG